VKEKSMIKRLTTAAALGLLLSACASGPPPEPPAPPPLDPTGIYDIVVSMEGMELPGVMMISGSVEEGYAGSIEVEMGGASIADVTVEGQILTFSIPDVEARVELLFEGDEFSGEMAGSMGSGTMYGKKRAGS
jgi:hypothetical protein